MTKRITGIFLALALLGSCAGIKARDEVLLPAMSVAFQGIAQDVLRGAQYLPEADRLRAEAEVEQIRVALETGDRRALTLLDWTWLHGIALDGIGLRIMAHDIGPGVAASLIERLAMFSASWEIAVAR